MIDKLSDIREGVRIEGLVDREIVEVRSAEWIGDTGLDLIVQGVESGDLMDPSIFERDLAELTIVEADSLWSFTADGELLRLVSEAHRIRLAHLFDPFVAVHSSDIEPLPHQIQAVYGRMLPRRPLRFLLADDPGAGKTIMAGLYMKELLIRGDLKRCLVIAPGSLIDNWQAELEDRFGLELDILERDMAAHGNPFDDHPFLIARMHQVAWQDEPGGLLEQLETSDPYDLIIVDEAHLMSARWQGGEKKTTKLYRLGETLCEKTRHLVLATATPHSGYHENFQLFLQLIDPDRFAGAPGGSLDPSDYEDLIRRMIKEDLVTMEGDRLFPPREARTLKYALSDEERDLYQEVTRYVRTEMNRAAEILDPQKVNVIGFALTVLQRRLASSPQAIYESLVNRRNRLTAQLEELREQQEVAPQEDTGPKTVDLISKVQHLDTEIREALEGEATDQEEEQLSEEASAATVAQTIPELANEIETLEDLEVLAQRVVDEEVDRKWDELAELLRSDEMYDDDGTPRKILIFTEHKATLDYLRGKVQDMLGVRAVVEIHGGVSRSKRNAIKERFWNDDRTRVLLGTDAAGVGINLHCANIVINYDLPWNPNRLEQRFGRVHRIGQKRRCYMFNMVAAETREGSVYETLLDKVEREFAALGGKVFDVLGEAFEDRPLRELLLQSIKDEEETDLARTVNPAINRAIMNARELLEEEGTAMPGLTHGEVREIHEDLQLAGARRLQPHLIRAFFLEAFPRLGGKIEPLSSEPGRFRITYVPLHIRAQGPAGGGQFTIQQRYDRVAFDKDQVEVDHSKHHAALLSPGHPLVDAVIKLTIDRHGTVLQDGAVLVDKGDPGTDPRLLVYIEDVVREEGTLPDGRPKTASREFHFLEYEQEEGWTEVAHAPYLDLEPLDRAVGEGVDPAEVRRALSTTWIPRDWRDHALSHAEEHLTKAHEERVRRDRERRADRILELVEKRLGSEIIRLRNREDELAEKALKDQSYRLAFNNVRERRQEMETRLKERRAELEAQRAVTSEPPELVGGVLVVPSGMLDHITEELGADRGLSGATDQKEEPPTHVEDTRTSELAAMRAVMELERKLGCEPKDVSDKRGLGYDIESWVHHEDDDRHPELRMIEVKGRHPDARAISFTKNEILAGLNKPESFILALAKVSDGEVVELRYVREPWEDDLDFATTRVEKSFPDLWELGKNPQG